jgi:hypothetical protein
MADEIAAFERTSTWDLASPPPGVHLIDMSQTYL